MTALVTQIWARGLCAGSFGSDNYFFGAKGPEREKIRRSHCLPLGIYDIALDFQYRYPKPGISEIYPLNDTCEALAYRIDSYHSSTVPHLLPHVAWMVALAVWDILSGIYTSRQATRARAQP